jgi:intracellular septation protein A
VLHCYTAGVYISLVAVIFYASILGISGLNFVHEDLKLSDVIMVTLVGIFGAAGLIFKAKAF